MEGAHQAEGGTYSYIQADAEGMVGINANKVYLVHMTQRGGWQLYQRT